MKVIHFNEGYRFGNPNLRWGNPSYVLEPGDPGYVPYPPVSTVVQTQKRKKSTMAKADYIEQNDDAYFAFDNTLAYAFTVGVALVYAGLPYGLLAAAYAGIARRLVPGRTALVGAWLWTGSELLRSHLFTGLPWELLGHTQFRQLRLI